MRRKISLVCLLLAWLCAHGVTWNVVQVVAWARMFHDYSQVMPVAQALQRTFDGNDPCNLCEIADTAENTARQQLPRDTLLVGVDKFVVATTVVAPVILPEPEQAWPASASARGLTRTDAVPVPPPRA